MTEENNSSVRKPAHYNYGNIEAIKVIEDWGLNFSLGSVIKYVCRAGRKNPATEIEDLKKAREYLTFEIIRLEAIPKCIDDLKRVYKARRAADEAINRETLRSNNHCVWCNEYMDPSKVHTCSGKNDR